MSQQESGIEVKVGALVLASLVLLGAFVFVLGDVSFGGGKRFNVVFENAGGLKPGADVAIAGLNVGQVESLSFITDESAKESNDPAVAVRATVRVEAKHAESITQASNFYISTRSVLGEPYIEVVTQSLDAPQLEPGSTVQGVSPPRTDLLVSKASRLLDEAVSLFQDPDVSFNDFFARLTALVGQLDDIVADNRGVLDQMIADGKKVVTNSAELLAAIKYAAGDGKSLRATVQDLRQTAANTRHISGKFEGQIGAISEDVAETSQNARKVSRVASELLADNQRQLDDSIANVHASTKNLKDMSGNADKLVRQIEQGEGTVGQLLQDRAVYDDLRELLRIVKRQPWKILWKE